MHTVSLTPGFSSIFVAVALACLFTSHGSSCRCRVSVSSVYLLCVSPRDLLRLGELQTELAGVAHFCATYLRCQLLLMKVCVCVVGLSTDL